MKNILLFLMVLIVTACNEENKYDAMGRFEARDVVVSSETSGILITADINEGQKVKKGEVLAVTDTMQLVLQRRELEAQIEAQLSSRPDIKKEASALRSQLSKQRKEESRYEKLLSDGAATSKELDDIRAGIKVIEGNLDALLSRLGNNTASINNNAAALRVRTEQTDDMISKCTVKSPIDGVVLSKYAEQGEYVQPGSQLVRIAGLDNMVLRCYFTSEQLADVKIGDKVSVAADFGGGRQRRYNGVVSWISSESEFTPKTVQTDDSRAGMVYAVKIKVKNDGFLKIGFIGEVYL